MFSEKEVVARVEGLTVRHLRRWVEAGWIRPRRRGHGHVFTEMDVARARLIAELRNELEINEAALPVVLSLLDQVYGLRQELRCLARAIQSLPRGPREQVLEVLRRRRNR